MKIAPSKPLETELKEIAFGFSSIRGDIKNHAFECKFELFKETIPGEYDLQIPK